MTLVSDGNGRKLAGDRQRSIDYLQSQAMTVGKENVPVCVPGHNGLAAAETPPWSTVLSRCPPRYGLHLNDLWRLYKDPRL